MQFINVMAVSLDGKIATTPLQNDAGRMSYGFGCKADHDFVRSEIAKSDAIITGANSVRASGGVWDTAGRNQTFPIWYVLTNHGIESDLKFWTQSHIPRVLVSDGALILPDASKNVENLCYASKNPTETILSHLKRQKVERVLIFGGGFVNQMFYEAGLVDELKVTISPIIVGRSEAPQFVIPPLAEPIQLDLLSSQEAENHLFLHYRIKKNS